MDERRSVIARQLGQAGVGAGERKRVAIEGAAEYDTSGEHLLHDFFSPSHGAQGDTARDRLAERGQIGDYSEMTLGAAWRNAESRDHFIENQQRSVLPRQLLRGFQIARPRHDASAVA